MTGVKALRLAVSSMLPLDNLSTDFEFLTAMTALEELYVSTSGLIHFINLLDTVGQRCSYPEFFSHTATNRNAHRSVRSQQLAIRCSNGHQGAEGDSWFEGGMARRLRGEDSAERIRVWEQETRPSKVVPL